MVRNKEYKKAVVQQNSVSAETEGQALEKISKNKQKRIIKPVGCPNCASTHFCP